MFPEQLDIRNRNTGSFFLRKELSETKELLQKQQQIHEYVPRTIRSTLWNDQNSIHPKIVNTATAVSTGSFYLRK